VDELAKLDDDDVVMFEAAPLLPKKCDDDEEEEVEEEYEDVVVVGRLSLVRLVPAIADRLLDELAAPLPAPPATIADVALPL
jgi:hypothetical protein